MTTTTKPRPLTIDYSVFPDVKGQLLETERSTWSELCDMLASPPEYPSKQGCPLLKLATFGDVRSAKGNSLRSDANMLEVFGIEGDYDGEQMAIEEGANMLRSAGVAALLYTRGSHGVVNPPHSYGGPRWRVLAPLSRGCQPGERRRLVAMLNGALGGVLAGESFTASQTYYYGKVRGADYQAIRVMGKPLDELELGETYPEASPTVQRDVVDDSDRAMDRMVVLAGVTDDTLKDLRSALSINPETAKGWIDPDDRVMWIAVAHDLKSLGDAGLDLWLEWSGQSAKFDDGVDDPHRAWAGCAGDRSDYRAVFTKAQRAGWMNPKSAAAIAATVTAETRMDRTDAGNVALLAEHTKGDLRFVPETKTWLAWTSDRWTPDPHGTLAHAAALQVAEHYHRKAAEIRAQARDSVLDDSERKRLKKVADGVEAWATQCRNKGRIDNMLSLAKVDARFAISVVNLDKDPWLFGVDNGVVDLLTGELRPDSRDEFVTQRSPVAFKPGAPAPRWLEFIDEITSEPQPAAGRKSRPELRSYMQRLLGYCLTGSTREHKMFIAIGEGSNGKSVLLDTVKRIVGDTCQTIAPEALMSTSRGGDAERATPSLRKLAGARMAVSSESKVGQRLDVAMVKQQTGDENMSARGLHENTMTFVVTHKVWLLSNHKPGLDHVDEATRGRLHMIPFDMRWNRPGHPERNPDLPDGDKTLVERLKLEAQGILAWLVCGAVMYQREGLEPPVEVARMTRTYFEDQDQFTSWIADFEVCDISEGTQAGRLFESFRTWCVNEGHSPSAAGTAKAFAAKLTGRGVISRKLRDGRQYAIKNTEPAIDGGFGPEID